MSDVRVVNDLRGTERPWCFFNDLWRPIDQHKKVYYCRSRQCDVLVEVRAWYLNQETQTKEVVQVLDILNMQGLMTLCATRDYLSSIYVHLRRPNGEEIHAQASLICSKVPGGRYDQVVVNYIFD